MPVDPSRLSKDELVQIVQLLQEWMYLDTDETGRSFWNFEKEVGGGDTIQFIDEILMRHRISPPTQPEEWEP